MNTHHTRQASLHTVMVLFIGLFCLPGIACAGTPDDAHGVRIQPYLWGAGFAGNSSSSDTDSDADDDILGDSEIGGFMLFGDWRHGRWSLLADWAYASVTSDASVSIGPLSSHGETQIRGHIVQLAAGYQIFQSERALVDLIGGVRYIHANVEIDVNSGILDGTSADGSDDWFDAVIGSRASVDLSDRWLLALYGDVGGGGSDRSWQVMGLLGYRTDWGRINTGWRHLDEDYRSGGFRLDAHLTGPFIGVELDF